MVFEKSNLEKWCGVACKFLIFLAITLLCISPFFDVEPYTNSSKKETIKILVRQASRWSAAAQQDRSPLIALLHANYGAGYLWALKDVATEREIVATVPGLDFQKFVKKITDIQDASAKKASSVCPSLTGNAMDPGLLKLAGDAS